MKPVEYTYKLRYELMEKYTNVKELKVLTMADAQDTIISLADQTLKIKFNDHSMQYQLKKAERVTISGHCLNLLMASQLSQSSFFGWLVQWCDHEVSLRKRDGVYLSKLKKLEGELKLFDYNASATNRWHSAVDILIALAISEEYVTTILNLDRRINFNNVIRIAVRMIAHSLVM